MPTKRCNLLRLLIFVLTFVVFARLIPCQFTYWDDEDTIKENPRLNPPSAATLRYYWTTAGEQETMGLYVPVTYTLWTALAPLARLWHLDPVNKTMLDAWPYHLTNVLLHSATSVLVFELLLTLISLEIPALIGALLFALHPVQVEAVGWVSGMKDLLFAFLSIASLLMYVRSVQCRLSEAPRWSANWKYAAGVFLFVLGMLSKPTAVVVPLMAAVISVILLRQSIQRTAISLLPWFVLMVPCVIWTQAVQPPAWISPLPEWAKPIVAADALAFYTYKLLWPVQLCIDYGRNPPTIAASHAIYFTWIVPVAIAAVLVWKRHQARPAVAAALLALLPLLPVLGFVPYEFQLISTTADHYLYLPMLGVAILITWASGKLMIRPIARVANRNLVLAASAIFAVYIVRDVYQESTWRDTKTLFTHVLAINPRSTPAYDGMGFLAGRDARQAKKQGRPREAAELFEQSIHYYQHSIELAPDSVPSLYNLALNYKETGQTKLGLEQAHRIVEAQAGLPTRLRADPVTVAHLLDDFGDYAGEAQWLQDALARDPKNQRLGYLWQKALLKVNGPSSRP